MENELENVIDEEVVVNDKFGDNPWYDTGSYDGYAKRKCMLPNSDFLTDQEIYDDTAHKALEFSVESVTGNKIEVNGEVELTITPTPVNCNVPECVWESSNPRVAYVKDGLVVGKSLGSADILVTDAYDTTITSSYTINVVENVEKAWQEENAQTITDELTEQGGGDVVITTGTVAEINVPDTITKNAKITAPLAENTTVTSGSGKSVYLTNTSDYPVNVEIDASASSGTYLTGDYGTVEINNTIRMTEGSVSNVVVDEETAKNVTVNVVFNENSSITNPTERDLTVGNSNSGKTDYDPSIDINSPESSVTLSNSWDTVSVASGDNTTTINNKSHINRLIVKKGNVIVKDTAVDNMIDEVVNDTEYTVSCYTKDCSTWSEFKSSAAINGFTNLVADVSTDRGISLALTASGNYEWNLGDKNLVSTNTYLFLARSEVHIDIKSDGGDVKGGGYGLWTASSKTVVNVWGGNWEAETTALYSENGLINIYGGSYSVTDDDKRYLLNCKDDNYTAGTAKIVVYGGKFFGFNPAESMGEPGGPVSFVADGYESVLVEEGVWEVRAVDGN